MQLGNNMKSRLEKFLCLTIVTLSIITLIGKTPHSFAGERFNNIKTSLNELKRKFKNKITCQSKTMPNLISDRAEVAAEGTTEDPRVDFTQALPDELVEEIFAYLSVEQLIAIYSSKTFTLKIREIASLYFQKIYKTFLDELVLLPRVTRQEVKALKQALRGRNETTYIKTMPAFRVAKSKTSIGLYHAVMGKFPELPLYGSEEILARWKANPDLPVTYSTPAEDMAFAKQLSKLTGRKFKVMSDSENEYSIRGRALDNNGNPTGNITASVYYFGDNEAQLSNYGWFRGNSMNQTHGVHENPDGYWHPFGLNQAIGNVWTRTWNPGTRSPWDDKVRGGSVDNENPRSATSSNRDMGYIGRDYNVGFRVSEDL